MDVGGAVEASCHHRKWTGLCQPKVHRSIPREKGAGVQNSLVSREERSVGKRDIGELKFTPFHTSPFSEASSHYSFIIKNNYCKGGTLLGAVV